MNDKVCVVNLEEMNSQRQWIPDPSNPTQWILNPNFHRPEDDAPVVGLPVVSEYLDFHGPGLHCSGPEGCSHISHHTPEQRGPPFIDMHGPGCHCTGAGNCPF